MSAKEKLIKSLFDILSIKKFEEISVSELCLVAKVHRTTFYAYYDNVYDLLEEAMEKVILQFGEEYKNDLQEGDYLRENILIPYLLSLTLFKYIYKYL